MHPKTDSLIAVTALLTMGAKLAIVDGRQIPYYMEYASTSIYTVDNSTLRPIAATSGLALQQQVSAGDKATIQVHTHVNFLYPAHINKGDCLCQLGFRMSDEVNVGGSSAAGPVLDVFELDSPTSETHHPDIAGYQGRLVAQELASGSGVAYTVFGMQPIACSERQLGGQLVGYEIAPKWWDDSADTNVTWSGKLSNPFWRSAVCTPCLIRLHFPSCW